MTNGKQTTQAEQMTRLFGGTIRSALVHAAAQYDIKQSTKRHYNHYAMAQYLLRIDEVEEDIENGASPRQALLSEFNGQLLDHLLRAIGEPKFTRDEQANQSYVYIPRGRQP